MHMGDLRMFSNAARPAWIALTILAKLPSDARINTPQGARSVDADLIHSARFLSASERQIMNAVGVPSALAWTFASLTPSISFALIGVVVGEFIGGESVGGLGYLTIQSRGTLNAADMMVALLVLGAIGIVMALGIKQL